MGDSKPRTATKAVVKSVLWSIGVTLAILGAIESLAYAGDPVPYFIISVIFGILWAAVEVKGRLRKK